MMQDLVQDARFALRRLLRDRGFTATAVLTLALGIAVNAVVLAVTYGLLLRPIPYHEPDRVVVISPLGPDGSLWDVPLRELSEWRGRLRMVQAVAGYRTRELTVRGLGDSQVVQAAFVTDSFFQVLGVSSARGRTGGLVDAGGVVVAEGFTDSTDDSADPYLTIGEISYPVTAVMPRGFGFPTDDVQVWLPLPPAGAWPPEARGYYRLVARLGPGISLQQVRDDAERVLREITGGGSDGSVSVMSLQDTRVGTVRPILYVAITAALLVLLVTCANVATLFIGRSVVRRRETQVRAALGAGPLRLLRGVLLETFVIAVVASLVGLGLGVVVLELFLREATGLLPRLGAVTIDLPIVLGVSVLMGVVTLLCAAIPARRVLRTAAGDGLRVGGPTGPPTARVQTVLVVAQIAMSIVLLTGAGLLTRTFVALISEDAGFEPRDALVARLVFSDLTLLEPAGRASFVGDLLETVEALPGVLHVGLGSNLPPRRPPILTSISIVSDTRDEFQLMYLGAATPGYFRALGSEVVSGRSFQDADAFRDEPVVVVSESAARFLYPREEAVGRTIPLLPAEITGSSDGRQARIVGVVRDIKYDGLDAPPGHALYVPWRTRPFGRAYVIVRTAGDPASLAPTIRRIISDLDVALPVPEVRSLEEIVAGSVADRRLRLVPAAGFALLALAVSLVGLVSNLARAVAERGRELAIRSALGASSGRLIGNVLARGAIITGLGVVVGVGGAAVSARGMAQLLYGVSPFDLMTFCAVAGLVAASALVAMYVPARKAAQVDPSTALRAE